MSKVYRLCQVRCAYVEVLGVIWMPAVEASTRINLSDYDLENIGEFTRENVEDWLSCHAGDFQRVIDFSAVCGEIELPWSSEDAECRYLDTLPCED